MTQLELIKQPRSIEDTGLDEELIIDLLLKHLYDGALLDLHQLTKRMKLPGTVVEALLTRLRRESGLQIHGAKEGSSGVRYQLTDLGRANANSAFLKSGYLGPAPISIDHYTKLVKSQSVHNLTLSRDDLKVVLTDVVINEELFDQLGPAFHSGRPILIYGHAGTGKTYISKKLAGLLGEDVYIPYAISVGKEIILYFDPLIHIPVESSRDDETFEFQSKADSRLMLCQRPVAISGGELTMDRLELNYDPVTRMSQAPIQMRANNGMYIVDDMGRQRMPPFELLNRWIVPMEEQQDYLSLATGKQFPVPFDTVLIFSTNLHPTDLADEAFLRRLGYKIHFSAITEQQFTQIWNDLIVVKNALAETGILTGLFELYKK